MLYTNDLNEIISIIILLAMYVGAYLFIIKRIRNTKLVNILLISAIFLRVLLTVINGYFIYLPHSGADTVVFERNAFYLFSGVSNTPTTSGYIYSRFIYLIYSIVGRKPLVICGINGVVSLFTGLMIFKSIQLITKDEKKALIGMFLFLLFPHSLIFSSIILRESLIVFFVTLSVTLFIKYKFTLRILTYILSIVSLLLATSLHSGVIFIGCAYIFYLFMDKTREINYRKWKKIFLITIFALTIIYIFISGSSILEKFSFIKSPESIIKRIQIANQRDAGSSYLLNLEISTVKDLLLYSPVRIFYFLFSPMVWDLRGFNDVIALLLDSLFYIFIVLKLFLSVRKIDYKSKNFLIFITFFLALVLLTIVYGMGSMSTGTALRHRYKMLSMIIIMMSIIPYKQSCKKVLKSAKTSLVELIKKREEKISIVGLGYVGIPLTIAFARVADVIGFDTDMEKVQKYNSGIDVNNAVGNNAIKMSTAILTGDEKYLQECKFHIIAVPTPINLDKTPDLNPIINASRIIGRNLTKGSIVVIESTVYPGVTEDVCVPILEKESNLQCGKDFKIGYSPERINPGDETHRLENIIKVVSGMDDETLDIIASVYELIIEAGVYRAESIKVAEASKVIENSQRDINIAFINELSIIFDKIGIDTKAVLDTAKTKWNFIDFSPGLVGGHCIGVDPYYLTYKAEEVGYKPKVILSGRKINDDMGKYIAEKTMKKLLEADKQIKVSKVAIFGVTFKENCSDVRNTKVVDIIRELESNGIEVKIVDPIANKDDLMKEYGLILSSLNEIEKMDVLIFAVPHEEFKKMSILTLNKYYRSGRQLLIDVKGIFNKEEAENSGFIYWRL